MNTRASHTGHTARNGFILLVLVLFAGMISDAQPPKVYTIRNGNMHIELGKQLKEASLDSFIRQFDLQGLALKQFIATGFDDSLKKYGWRITVNTPTTCVITKPLVAAEDINNVAYKAIVAGKAHSFDVLFPAVSNSVVLGYNRFRNKFPFRAQDSMVTFFLRNNLNASKVMLAGSFNDWRPDALAMTRTDSGWIAQVKLGPGKYWYKFIRDGNWMTDNDNRITENDGLGNTNSVFYKTNRVFRLEGFTNARRVYLAGSFNNWAERDLEMVRTSTGWELPVYLAEGTHTYRFIVDGRWMADPGNSDRLPNEFNDYNSVVRIGKPHLFKLDGYTDAKKVVLTGSFNKWRKDELFMKKTATGWELEYVLGPGNYEYRFVADNREFTDPAVITADPNGNSYLVLQPNYTFRLKGFDKAKKIYLAGDFNNWSPNSYAMKREGDEWVFTVHLSPGKHLYKFVVDGKWIIDPANKLWEQNEHNTGNSVIWIEEGKAAGF